MSAELVPKIEGFEFKLMKPREIEKRRTSAYPGNKVDSDELYTEGVDECIAARALPFAVVNLIAAYWPTPSA